MTTQLQQALYLARKNYFSVAEYFGYDPLIFETCEEGEEYVEQLLLYLRETSELLLNRFAIPLANDNQYRFLRGLWAGHNTRSRDSTQFEDKIDSLNQVISQLKVRMRGLTQAYNKEQQNAWDQQQMNRLLSTPQEHPIFQRINQKMTQQAFQICDLSEKVALLADSNERLKAGNHELEGKVTTLKDKCRKSERQIFQITKKKAQMQKKYLQQSITQSVSRQCEGAKTLRQPAITHSLSIKGVEFVEQVNFFDEQRQEQSNKQNERKNTDSTIPQPKMFKRAFKKAVPMTQSTNMLDSSIDSIKNIKFSRQNSRKLLMSNADLSRSIRYVQKP